MSFFALVLVLVAAVIHAGWNLLAKKTNGGIAFVWLVAVLASALYTPLALAVIYLQEPRLDRPVLLAIFGSTFIHTGYFLLLLKGYQAGDLSLVYPLARGTGPTLSVAAAMIFLAETPTPLAVAGSLLIAAGIFVLTTGPGTKAAAARTAVFYGVLCGTFIAGYTLWDKYAISTLLAAPLILEYGRTLTQAVILAPIARMRWNEVELHWREHRTPAIAVALFGSLGYILILTVMVYTPVSYVAPAREVSILFGSMMGSRLLSEGNGRRRLLGSAAMVTGIVALTAG